MWDRVALYIRARGSCIKRMTEKKNTKLTIIKTILIGMYNLKIKIQVIIIIIIIIMIII